MSDIKSLSVRDKVSIELENFLLINKVRTPLERHMEVILENKPDEIIFTTDDGEQVVFEVIEQTRLGGINYLLVSTAEDADEGAEALILKDISKDTDEEAIYDIVEDDKELKLVADIFKELLDDIELN